MLFTGEMALVGKPEFGRLCRTDLPGKKLLRTLGA
jgi:hypothetical protein